MTLRKLVILFDVFEEWKGIKQENSLSNLIPDLD